MAENPRGPFVDAPFDELSWESGIARKTFLNRLASYPDNFCWSNHRKFWYVSINERNRWLSRRAFGRANAVVLAFVPDPLLLHLHFLSIAFATTLCRHSSSQSSFGLVFAVTAIEPWKASQPGD